jgi:hypothetical protein
MNEQNKERKLNASPVKRIRQSGRWPKPLMFALILTATVFGVLSVSAQTAPVLVIAAAPTNQISISVTNAILTDSYEVWWTPVLGDTTGHPWTLAAPGSIGQTNFLLNKSQFSAVSNVFFMGLLDTNTPPLWENANPSNHGTNILKITIASPANGALLQ